jgi:multiple sugar transport system substrate-binding protein
MPALSRRRLLATAAVGGLMAAARPTLAQNKPDKLVYIGDNQGGWKRALTEEVAPAFEKETGIKVEFTLLPFDAWQARMKAEFGAGSSGIDIAQWSVGMGGWIAPHMLDHQEVLATIKSRDPEFDWDDFLAGSQRAATYDGKLSGIPYRTTTGILVYQKALLNQAGFAEAPGTFAEFEKAALTLNTPPDRYAVGLMGKQGVALYSSLASWLYSIGGRLVDFKTGEIFVNDDKGVTALQFMADLVVKDKVTPPEVTTWEFDEIIAGGQRDRYVMAQTFAPYMTLINDPALSKTGGNWSADLVPGYTDKSQSRSWVDGHFLAVPKYAAHPDWSIEFIRMACSKKWQLRSMERGNAPPRGSVLNDPTMAGKLGWPPIAARSIETGIPTPAHPVWTTLELTLRTGVSEALQGQKTAKEALDAVASDWQRTLRRAGIGHA